MQLDRRQAMTAALALAATPAKAFAGPSTPAGAVAPGSLRDIAGKAWLYLLPLTEIASVRSRILAAGPANNMVHQQQLLTTKTQRVTSPNNDTLYSRAIIDLRAGPVEVTVPPSGDRYLSVALMDMLTNNFAILGTRTTGRNGGRFVVVGPNGAAVPGAIRAPSDSVFILGRTLADGPEDMAAARRVQTGIVVSGPVSAAPWAAAPNRDAPWPAVFAAAAPLLAETGIPVTDNALLERIAPLGFSRSGFKPPAFSATEIAEIEAGISDARTTAMRVTGGTLTVDGWAYPGPSLGRFNQNYEFRAQIALTGLFALPTDEAIYTRSVGDAADGLFHGGAYRLHFKAGALPPVDAFWSLTAYEATPAGQFFFADNPIDRYAIGDRTPGLKKNRDGSLDIWITRADPGPDKRSNWLPAPQKAFMLSLRAYLPQQKLVSGAYRFPAVT